ncbi:MAG: hypothetical protein PVI86_11590 [Phycisphaerae bacterium]|jgi:hypothetical protein
MKRDDDAPKRRIFLKSNEYQVADDTIAPVATALAGCAAYKLVTSLSNRLTQLASRAGLDSTCSPTRRYARRLPPEFEVTICPLIIRLSS